MRRAAFRRFLHQVRCWIYSPPRCGICQQPSDDPHGTTGEQGGW